MRFIESEKWFVSIIFILMTVGKGFVYSITKTSSACKSTLFVGDTFKKDIPRINLSGIEQYTPDQNASFWEMNKKCLQSISKRAYNEIHTQYETEQIFSINIDLGYSTMKKRKLFKASYNTLVIANIKNSSNRNPSQEYSILFHLIDLLFESNIKVDRLVFYGIDNISLEPYEERKDRLSWISPNSIVFHDTSAVVCNRIEDYLYHNFNVYLNLAVVYNNMSSDEMSHLSCEVLCGIFELKLADFPTKKQCMKIKEMSSLKSLWIGTYNVFVPSDINTRSLSSLEVLRIKHLYVHLDALDHYLIKLKSSCCRIIPINKLTILVDQAESGTILADKVSLIKETEYDFSWLPKSVEIGFGVSNGKSLTPETISRIFLLICKLDRNRLSNRITIENTSFNLRKSYGIVQVPLYYIAKKKKDRQILRKYEIVILTGEGASDVHLRPMPHFRYYSKQQDRNISLSQSTVIMERKKFLEYIKSPPKAPSSSKASPRALSLIYSKMVNSGVKCMHCKKVIGIKENFSSENEEYIMLYVCGHVSCALCGYKHVSEGFKKLPKCMVCNKLIDRTMVYVDAREVVKEIYGTEIISKTLLFPDALDYSGCGFVFSYGSGDSSIIYDIAHLFIAKEKSQYKWSKYPFEKSFSYLVSADKETGLPCHGIYINHAKERIEVSMDLLSTKHAENSMTVYISRKKSFLEILSKKLYGQLFISKITSKKIELLKDKNTTGFTFACKWADGMSNRSEEFKKIEDLLVYKIKNLSALCTLFWNINGWE